jgi:hypothetical protein
MKTKKTRQQKAKRILNLTARRMLAKLLAMKPIDLNPRAFESYEFCEEVRDMYERNRFKADRLLKNYDLASIVV